jgi:hypothetical protein
MHLHGRYKQGLTEKVGKDAASRWADTIETNDPTRTMKELVATASAGGRTIAHVLIRGEDLP